MDVHAPGPSRDDLTDYEREILGALLERAEDQARRVLTRALADRFAEARRALAFLT